MRSLSLTINIFLFSATFEEVSHHIVSIIKSLVTTYEAIAPIVKVIGNNLTWLIEIKIVIMLLINEHTNTSRDRILVDLNASEFALIGDLPLYN